MKCPRCRSSHTEVYNSRLTKFDTQVWRRRRCLACQETFTTYEAVDLGFIMVTKKVGKPQGYSRAKLFSSIYGAFADIESKPTTIDAVTATVETKILDMRSAAISTEDVANLVLQTLKHYSTAAFIRYLSSRTDLVNEAQLRKELKKY